MTDGPTAIADCALLCDSCEREVAVIRLWNEDCHLEAADEAR